MEYNLENINELYAMKTESLMSLEINDLRQILNLVYYGKSEGMSYGSEGLYSMFESHTDLYNAFIEKSNEYLNDEQKNQLLDFFSVKSQDNDNLEKRSRKLKEFSKVTYSANGGEIRIRRYKGKIKRILVYVIYIYLKLFSQRFKKDLKIDNFEIKIDNSRAKIKREIEILFHLFLDTGLPLYFYQGLSRDLYIHLKETVNWSIDSDSFETGKTDIILHSFSHAVALNKISTDQILFIPLFEFSGYSLIIKNNSLNIQGNDINQLLRSNKWFEELQSKGYKFHVEKSTDLYWVAYRFFKEKVKKTLSGYTEEKMHEIFDNHVINSNGIQNFINDENAVILSTNNLFATYFKQDLLKDNYTVIEGKEYFEHKNLNGFIFTKSFANRNLETIKILLDNWFKQVNLLKKTYNRIIEYKSRHEKMEDLYLNQFDIFCEILNNKYGININRQQMASNFKFQNIFFETIINSKSSFRDNINQNHNDYLELCKINYEKFKELCGQDSSIEMNDLQDLIIQSQTYIDGIK